MRALTRCRLASVALLGLALGGTAVASNVSPGADPPNISGTWLNRQSTTLKDLKGLTVLVEFWGTHWGPCIALIPHLNQLQEKFKSRGLVVVGVTNGTEEELKQFVADKGIKYAIAIDGSAGGAYGVNGIPDSVLIGPDGKVVWAGHPTGLKEGSIEDCLKSSTLMPGVPPLPASLARFNALFQTRKFGKAYLDLKKAVQDKKASEADAGPTIEGLEGRMKTLLSGAEKAREEKDYYALALNASELKTSFAGTTEAKKAADLVKEVEKDQAARDQLKAAETLEKLDRAMEARAFADAYRGYRGLQKKFGGTTIEKAAGERIQTIEKEKLLSYQGNCPACKKDGKPCSKHRA